MSRDLGGLRALERPRDSASLADTMARYAGAAGLMPEQDWELPDLAASPFGTDPMVASIGCARHPQGTISISANAISRFITFSVPTSSLGGQPGSGWAFTVVLTGQDGFSPDQARSFASTPQPFQFGVCASPSSDVHCSVDPNTVPKIMDVLTPAGVSQADELDYTLHPTVTLQEVLIP